MNVAACAALLPYDKCPPPLPVPRQMVSPPAQIWRILLEGTLPTAWPLNGSPGRQGQREMS